MSDLKNAVNKKKITKNENDRLRNWYCWRNPQL